MKKILFASLCLISSFVQANGGTYVAVTEHSEPDLFMLLGLGASFSQNANIIAPPPFDIAVEGYDAKLANSVLYTVGLGLRFNSLFTGDIGVTRRPSFSYEKFQAGTDEPGSLGAKIRFFDLSNTSIMANIYLKGQGVSDKLGCSLGNHGYIQPFLGAGLGVAYNTVSNFRTVIGNNADVVNTRVATIEHDKTKASFAWQLMAGVSTSYYEKFNLDVGYRYFNGGNFQSNNYADLFDGTWRIVPAWNGKLRANEVFVNFSYIFV